MVEVVRSISFSASSTRLRAANYGGFWPRLLCWWNVGERAVGVGVAEVGAMEEVSSAWSSVCGATSFKLRRARDLCALIGLRRPTCGWRRGVSEGAERERAMLTSLKRLRSETRSRSE